MARSRPLAIRQWKSRKRYALTVVRRLSLVQKQLKRIQPATSSLLHEMTLWQLMYVIDTMQDNLWRLSMEIALDNRTQGDIYEHASMLFDMIGVFEVIEDAVSKQFWLLHAQGEI